MWNGWVGMCAYECGTAERGDSNCDGAANNFDVDAFVMPLTEPSAYAAADLGYEA